MVATKTDYEAKFPALFVDWAERKIDEWVAQLEDPDSKLTSVQRRLMEADISFLTNAIAYHAEGPKPHA